MKPVFPHRNPDTTFAILVNMIYIIVGNSECRFAVGGILNGGFLFRIISEYAIVRGANPYLTFAIDANTVDSLSFYQRVFESAD